MPCVYYITDRKSCSIPLLDSIQRAIEASVDFIQIREKDLPARELFSLATAVRNMARGHHTKILINDRLDIALAANLDGLHLGQNSIPAARIRDRISRQDFIIGISTHSFEEVKQAGNQGINYILLGPIFFTPSKASYGRPLGLQSLRIASRSTTIPVLALGGVERKNYAECLMNGACGIAAIRLFQNPKDPLKEIVSEIKGCS